MQNKLDTLKNIKQDANRISKAENEAIVNNNDRVNVQEPTDRFLEDDGKDDLVVKEEGGSVITAQLPVKETDSSSISENVKNEKHDPDFDYVKAHLKKYKWYHGMVVTEKIEPLLKWPYSFVVRLSCHRDGRRTLCMTIRLENKSLDHYEFSREKNRWKCKDLLKNKGASGSTKTFVHIAHVIDYWSLTSPCIPISRPKYTIQHDDTRLEERLGSSAFSEVWMGSYRLDCPIKDCALKTVKGTVTRDQLKRFHCEADIMTLIDHECVIKLFGVCNLMSPLMLVMELAVGGTVRSYMREKKDVVTLETIFGFVYDISRGMSHIASKNIIHRDLAARNCLIGSKLVVKISDFGLAVKGPCVTVKTLKLAPMRWLSPETFEKGIFNEKTDVWSFGVTVWEILTKCEALPLYPKPLKQVETIIRSIENPHKLSSRNVNKRMKNLLLLTTKKNPDERPTFKIIEKKFKKYCEDYHAIVNIVEHMKAKQLRKVGKQKSENDEDVIQKIFEETSSRKKSSREKEMKSRGTRSGNKSSDEKSQQPMTDKATRRRGKYSKD